MFAKQLLDRQQILWMMNEFLGQNWLITLRFNWCSLNFIVYENKLSELLKKYDQDFDGQLGTIKEIKAVIKLKSDATTYIIKPRQFCFL